MTSEHRGDMPAAVQIQGADGEWVEIGHVAKGGLVLGEPDVGDLQPLSPLAPHSVTVTVEDVEALRPGILAVAEAYRRAVLQMAPVLIKTFRQLIAAAESAGHRDEYVLAPPRPGRHRDRPAWQSPYGPPARRRR